MESYYRLNSLVIVFEAEVQMKHFRDGFDRKTKVCRLLNITCLFRRNSDRHNFVSRSISLPSNINNLRALKMSQIRALKQFRQYKYHHDRPIGIFLFGAPI
jgi:hypothetical protein